MHQIQFRLRLRPRPRNDRYCILAVFGEVNFSLTEWRLLKMGGTQWSLLKAGLAASRSTRHAFSASSVFLVSISIGFAFIRFCNSVTFFLFVLQELPPFSRRWWKCAIIFVVWPTMSCFADWVETPSRDVDHYHYVHCFTVTRGDNNSGKSGPKDQVALHYYYTSPSHWCTTHEVSKL